MMTFLATLLCRFTGRACSPRRPASRDLINEMGEHARKVEANTIGMRRQRERTGNPFADAYRSGQGRRP